MHGHPVTSTHSSRLSLITSRTTANLVSVYLLTYHQDCSSVDTEETLIDFRELQGEHSGENMAEEVWAALQVYGLEGRVCNNVMDNAANCATVNSELTRFNT